jgi:dienelactone hydrolase
VYIVDFFENEQLPLEPLLAGRFDQIDMAGFTSRNGRTQREAEIVEAAKYLKGKYKKIGAVGYCFGGWSTFRLAGLGLIDAGCVGHPTWLTREDIDGAVDGAPDREGKGEWKAVPMKVLAPEVDGPFDLELKKYCVNRYIESKNPGAVLEYRHFPGVEHACFTRGDEKVKGERDAMRKGKGSAVAWFKEWLVEG